ncbi:MAG: TonB-dependent receptor plug domain-containing protein [Flavobacteriaceae bacterium]|jgi:vitamin B12 transporter|nr:TonB-dependent receptor [Flavobacteriaceae bacterium]|tara:strand:+ start:470 stop:2260 length:1791 start_codon:yes stop_codon:yes gene_type:complete
MNRFYFSALVPIVVVFSSLAQTPLDEVVVSSPRLNVLFSDDSKSVTVITAEQIDDTPVSNLVDLLRFQSGIDIRRQGIEGTQADVYLRGGTFDQVLLLIDGIRVDDPQTGHHTLNSALPLDVIERIEIVKGPAARIYGQNALTGAINIVTKKEGKKGTNLNVGQGSFHTTHLGVTAQDYSDNQQHVVHFSRLGSEGYRHNTDLDNLHFFTHSAFGASKNLKLLTMFNDRKFGANGFYGYASYEDQYEETQSSLVALTTSFVSEKAVWTPRVFWKRGQDEYILIRNNPSAYRNMHINNKIGFSLDTKLTHSNGNLSGLGVELSSVSLQSNNLGTHSRTLAHFFFEHRFKLYNFNITPGFALSHFSDIDTFFYPGLDVGFKLSDKAKLVFNTGYTYRVPTYTDLYYNGPTALGNADLKPEKALSHELSFSYNTPSWELEVALFQRNSENLIDYVEVTVGDSQWLASNIHDVITRGGELNSSYKYTIGKQLQTLVISYGYIHDNYTKTVNSRYALNSLKHNINLLFLNRLSPKWSTSFSYRYATRPLGGHFKVLNAQLEYVMDKFTIEIQGRNLFDASYYENLIPMPGAHGMLSLRYAF